MLGQAESAVADVHLNSVITGLQEPLSGQLGELRDPLDRVHLRRELGENGGLVPGAGADVEHALAAGQLQRLADARDHVRLGDRLAPVDRKGGVFVRATPLALANELLAWDGRHCAEHAFVDDVAPAQLRLDHGAAPAGLLVLRRHARERGCRRAVSRRSARAQAAPVR